MQHDTDDLWLNLQEASALLGVATSTVRRWGDSGRLPTRRTLGGHRRFQRSAVEQLQHELNGPPHMPDIAPTRHWSIDHRELMGQDWHTRFASNAATERMRGLGQRLLGMLIQHINSSDERMLTDARDVGQTYGREARDLGVSLSAAVEAFLFFRRTFARLARPHPAATPPDSADVARLRSRLDDFMDEILLGLIAGFETPASQAIAGGS